MGPTRGSLRRYQEWVSSLQRLVDGGVIILAQLFAQRLYAEAWREQTMTITVIGLLVYVFAAEFVGIYRPWRLQTIALEIRDTLIAWLPVPLTLLAFWFFSKTSTNYSRVAAFGWFMLAPLLLCGLRITVRVGLRILRARGYNTRRVAILGCTPDAERLARWFDDQPWLGLSLDGVYDDRSEDRRYRTQHRACKVIGNTKDLVRQCRAGEIDVVYVALPLRAEQRTAAMVAALADTTAAVYLVADFFQHSLAGAQWSQVGDVPVVSVRESPFRGVVGLVKRIEDLILGSIIVSLTALPMIAIAIAVKLSSPGPVIFRQWRYGLSGKRIRILKFRTMTVCEDGANVVQASKNDPRITRVGRFLRRTSLDEFPQFLQVITGEISLVGPRPHAVAHNEQYRSLIQGYMVRHMVKPGITGWAQVNGYRGETAELAQMEQRIKHDLEYIRNWNLLLDIRIIFRTILGAVKGRNAY
jgi:putative colanic acid biosysnthesis UDP-glucose lipid carrier transferase